MGKNVFETRGCALLKKLGIFDWAEMHGKRRNFVLQRCYHKCRMNAAVIALYQMERKLPTVAVCTTKVVFNVPIIYHVTFLLAHRLDCDQNDEDQCLVTDIQ